MANKYANLVGANKIKDEYTKINTGFDGVETDIEAVNDLIDAVDSRVDMIITTPIEGAAAAQEIVDARVSAVKEKTFATLDARFEETEQDIATHKADNVTDVDGVHGLKVEIGTFTPVLRSSSVEGSNTYAIQTGVYTKIGNIVHFTANVKLSAKDATMSGEMFITGLPFAVNNTSVATVGLYSGVSLETSAYGMSSYITTTAIRLRQNTATSTVALNDTNITAYTQILVSGTYKV